ncbi:MAG: sigma-70 family RNA polymerase sigma factor [Verrucomicrobia bacterium]|nr:sigma-70 family RNA polymerase sigma factor [Verrucomicrobiota bacterium]
MVEANHDELKVGSDDLLPQVYEELRRMAAAQMAREVPGHTLQPTALVHEAWMRISGGPSPWKSRAHFFGAAAEAMRRILVDAARRKRQLKRGNNPERVELQESRLVAPVEDDKLLQVNEVLDRLAAEDPVKAEIVKLRYFVGLNYDEIAQALEVNERTVRRHWEVAKIRLIELMGKE